MGPWPCFWMVLDTEDGFFSVAEALQRFVVEVDVRLFEVVEPSDVHTKTVILGGDVDLACGKVLYRVVHAVVAELELEAAAA